jgi:hypothetical protein
MRSAIVLVVAPIVLLVVISGGWAVLGLAGYIILVSGIVTWNFAALYRAISNRMATFKGLFAPQNLSVEVAYVIVFLVWGLWILDLWGDDRTWYAIAYAIAAGVAASALLTSPETRRMRNYLFLVYNVIGTLAIGSWAAADAGGDGGLTLAAFAQGWGIMQVFLFIWGAYFAPIFFLPPFLVLEPRIQSEESAEPVPTEDGPDVTGEARDTRGTGGRRRGPVRRVASLTMDSALGAMVVLLLLFTMVGVGNVGSWQDLPDPEDAVYGPSSTFEFAAMGRAFTDRPDPVGSWSDVVDEEIDRATDLGLDFIRYDLHKEFIDDEAHLVKMDMAIERIRDAGMDVMLSPFGSGRWEADHPTFDAMVAEIERETLLLVERYEPAWVLPFFEPNGQVAVNLGKMVPAEEWLGPIDTVGSQVRALSNTTRVLIEVAIEPEEGLALVDALSTPGLSIDAIGIDPYPLSAEDLDAMTEYRDRAQNPELGFWISEFGVESSMSGQEGQARALSYVLTEATGDLNASGICVWALLDDTVLPSNLGLVSRDGTPKEAYHVLKAAIVQVRAD